MPFPFVTISKMSYIAGFIFPWLAIIRKELHSTFNFKQRCREKEKEEKENGVCIRKTFI